MSLSMRHQWSFFRAAHEGWSLCAAKMHSDRERPVAYNNIPVYELGRDDIFSDALVGHSV